MDVPVLLTSKKSWNALMPLCYLIYFDGQWWTTRRMVQLPGHRVGSYGDHDLVPSRVVSELCQFDLIDAFLEMNKEKRRSLCRLRKSSSLSLWWWWSITRLVVGDQNQSTIWNYSYPAIVLCSTASTYSDLSDLLETPNKHSVRLPLQQARMCPRRKQELIYIWW